MRVRRRRWVALSAGAIGVALAIAVVYLALEAPLADPAESPSPGDRRPARPDARWTPVEAPLVRVSKTHVVVHGRATEIAGDGGAEFGLERPVSLLLDTGLSVVLATSDGEKNLGIHRGAGEPLASSSFSGSRTELAPADESTPVVVSAARLADPARVATRVEYVATDALEGADVVLPPWMLGPRGGAVRLDLDKLQFRACDALADCSDPGAPRISESTPCRDYPDLIVVTALVNGNAARLLLDTGGSTWFDRGFFWAYLATRSRALRPGDLYGSGHDTVHAKVAEGPWSFVFGDERGARTTASQIWVVDPTGGAVSSCGLDGAVGLDVFEGCTLVIADGSPPAVHASCPPKPR